MKSSVVPSQITTVEDRIAGNLNMTQLLLLTTPLFWGSSIYVLAPPAFSFAVYKIVLSLIFLLSGISLAIRIKDRLVLSWLKLFAAYYLRPRLYLFDKNDHYLRDVGDAIKPEEVEESKKELAVPAFQMQAITKETVFLESIIASPSTTVTLKKGRLGVEVAYVKTDKIVAPPDQY